MKNTITIIMMFLLLIYQPAFADDSDQAIGSIFNPLGSDFNPQLFTDAEVISTTSPELSKIEIQFLVIEPSVRKRFLNNVRKYERKAPTCNSGWKERLIPADLHFEAGLKGLASESLE